MFAANFELSTWSLIDKVMDKSMGLYGSGPSRDLTRHCIGDGVESHYATKRSMKH